MLIYNNRKDEYMWVGVERWGRGTLILNNRIGEFSLNTVQDVNRL